MTLKNTPLNRRRFFAASSAAALTAASSAKAATTTAHTDMQYEVIRTDAEWREMLTEFEYAIMREGKTEKPKSHPLWEEIAEGSYHCKGCDLKIYDGRWKSILEKGWLFFYHGEPDSYLTSIDGEIAEYGSMSAGFAANTEVHCRRCASHLGHIFYVERRMRHCINGTSLTFKPVAA